MCGWFCFVFLFFVLFCHHWVSWIRFKRGGGGRTRWLILRDPSSLCCVVLKWKEVVRGEWRIEDQGCASAEVLEVRDSVLLGRGGCDAGWSAARRLSTARRERGAVMGCLLG